MNVFDIEDIRGTKTAVVTNSIDCTMCRECIRKDNFNDKIELGKKRNHYIFTIESVGVVPPQVLFSKALEVMKEKIQHYTNYFNLLKNLKKENIF